MDDAWIKPHSDIFTYFFSGWTAIQNHYQKLSGIIDNKNDTTGAPGHFANNTNPYVYDAI